jgi:hypothetical protein
MPTVIDSLIVELGLDPEKFTKGQKEAASAFTKTKDQLKKDSKEVESSFDNLAEGFNRARGQLLGFIGLVVGSTGLKDFIANVTKSEIETGRFSKALGLTTESLSSWQGAAAASGGTASGITGTLRNLTNQLQLLSLTGESNTLPYFRALGVSLVDNNGHLKKSTALILDLADAIQKNQLAPERAFTILSSLGIDDATIALILKGRNAVQDYLKESEKLGVITNKDIESGAALQRSWEGLAHAATSLGTKISTILTPAITNLLDGFTKLFSSERKSIESGNKEGSVGSTPSEILGGIGESWGAWWRGEKYTPPWDRAKNRVSASDVAGTTGLRLKQGASIGGESIGLMALASSLQSDISGLNRFTSLNDQYHKGTSSKHAQGLALDFTLSDPGQAEAVSSKIRAKLNALGVDAKVIDEYLNPSGGSTGGHIHVQFNSAAAAQRYSELAGGAGAAASSNINNSRSAINHVNSETNIDNVNIHTSAIDADGIAKDIRGSLQKNSLAAQANYGLQ